MTPTGALRPTTSLFKVILQRTKRVLDEWAIVSVIFHEKLGFFMLLLDFIRVKRRFVVTIHDSDFYHLNKEALEQELDP